jgi:hypothetical protein
MTERKSGGEVSPLQRGAKTRTCWQERATFAGDEADAPIEVNF